MAKPSMDDYIDVAERIAEFRGKHPEGCLQQVDLQFVEVAGKAWVVYTAAAYRTPDDVRPGHGTAWEPVPGPTRFTENSEVQNAETSAWGRAIVAVLAADTKRGVASAQEVRNRSQAAPSAPPPGVIYATSKDVGAVAAQAKRSGWSDDDVRDWLYARCDEKGYPVPGGWDSIDVRAVNDLTEHLTSEPSEAVPA